MDKVAENLISGLAGLAAGYIVAEGYKQLVSTSEKKSWECDVKMKQRIIVMDLMSYSK